MNMGFLESIKEIGIFIIIAQCILHLVPGASYTKYVKVLVGIMMIARLAEPVLSIVAGDERIIWQEQTSEFANMLEMKNQTLKLEDSKVGIYSGIEEELKNRMNGLENTGYQVTEVELSGIGNEESEKGETVTGEERMIVHVEKTAGESGSQNIESVKIKAISLSGQAKEGQEKEQKKNNDELYLKQEFSVCTGVDESKIQIVFQD